MRERGREREIFLNNCYVMQTVRGCLIETVRAYLMETVSGYLMQTVRRAR